MRGWPAPGAVRTLWVVRESALGDVILTEPLLRALKDRYPAARLSLVTRAPYHPLFVGHPAVGSLMTPAQAASQGAPDLVVDLQNRLRTQLLGRGARSRRTWRKRGWADLWRAARGLPLHRSYRGGPDQRARLARDLGWPAALDVPRLSLSGPTPVRAGEVVLCPAASKAVKRWPPEGFGAIGRRLLAAGRPVWVAGGPGEEALLEEVSRLSGGRTLSVDAPLDELGAGLAAASLVVGNDTGLLHLAAAVGTRVVVIFGPTSPGRWGPPRERGDAVTIDPPCGPCSDYGQVGCRRARRTCLEDLPEAAVWAAARRAVDPAGEGASPPR